MALQLFRQPNIFNYHWHIIINHFHFPKYHDTIYEEFFSLLNVLFGKLKYFTQNPYIISLTGGPTALFATGRGGESSLIFLQNS